MAFKERRRAGQAGLFAGLCRASQCNHPHEPAVILIGGFPGFVGIEQHRLLSSELAQALIERKAQKPELQVLCLTDPVNRAYGTREETFYSKLAQGGIPVVFTDLDRLPDSNPVYAYPVRFYGGLLRKLGLGQAWADRPRHRHPFQSGGDPVSTRQAVRLLRFKANHRKVVIADRAGGEPRMIVTSFNPADSSSAHANIGLLVSGEVARQALTNELACVTWSAEREANVLADRPDRCAEVVQRIAGSTATPLPVPESGPRVAWLTEGAIRARLISMLDDAGPGDRVRIAMFYLSDRVLVRSIKDAAFAGARVRVILDFNRDAFGRKKNGIPNRPVAAELAKFARDENLRMEVRWADTHGEQFHTKALSISNDEMGKHLFLCGSANWTRRNLSDLNMEANLYCERAPGVVKAFSEYFDRAWSNSDGLSHTLAFGSLAETRWPTIWKTALYVVQEVTGLCSF